MRAPKKNKDGNTVFRTTEVMDGMCKGEYYSGSKWYDVVTINCDDNGRTKVQGYRADALFEEVTKFEKEEVTEEEIEIFMEFEIEAFKTPSEDAGKALVKDIKERVGKMR